MADRTVQELGSMSMYASSADYWKARAEAAEAKLAEAQKDAERLEFLEQRHWEHDELFELVNNWVTQGGKRHAEGLRSAIDAAMQQGADK